MDSTRNAWGVPKSLCVLAGATAVIAWLSYQLVGSFEAATHALGLTEVFVGVIIVAIIGNVAEHSSAVLVARKSERLDLSWSIAIGSSLQIALFVAPVLVFASYLFGKTDGFGIQCAGNDGDGVVCIHRQSDCIRR